MPQHCDYLVVGLGNPGRNYHRTKHNCGFLVLDLIAEKYRVKINKLKSKAAIAYCSIDDKNIILCKPQTFMNLSGESVGPLAAEYKIPPEHIIVVQDDIDLPSGKIRIKRGGSHGGHNGIRDIIRALDTGDFIRVKIGVGKPDIEVRNFVLSPLDSDAFSAISHCPDAVISVITHGAEKAMGDFNGKNWGRAQEN